MTLNVFSSYKDCDDVPRHPSSASDRLKSTAAQRQIAEGAEARPIGPVESLEPRRQVTDLVLDVQYGHGSV